MHLIAKRMVASGNDRRRNDFQTLAKSELFPLFRISRSGDNRAMRNAPCAFYFPVPILIPTETEDLWAGGLVVDQRDDVGVALRLPGTRDACHPIGDDVPS